MADITLFAFHFHDGPHFSAESTGSLFGDASSSDGEDAREGSAEPSDGGSRRGADGRGGPSPKALLAIGLVLAAVAAAVAWKVAGSGVPAELEALDEAADED